MKKIRKYFPIGLLLPLLLWSCQGSDSGNGAETPTNPAPGILNYSQVASYPHDTSSYTQGLQIYKGRLFEGTGQYGSSVLLEADLSTGKRKQSISLDKQYFGEGVTILNDTIYQLTWREHTVFVYTLDLKKIREYKIDKDGWGLTNNEKELILSNGSGDLFFYDPHGMKLVRTQLVTEAGSPSYNLNELEYIDGYVYANQYTTPYIFKIDPATGEIVAKADITRLWEQAKQIYPDAEVPNGIAYDNVGKKIYVTGKWWPQLYEIRFGQ